MEKRRLIYQVCLGNEKQSKLYDWCINSVKEYCHRHNIDHYLQTTPRLRISPDPFMTNRSNESYMKHGGFLPIYEKENAFSEEFLDRYDQIAIIDADIYVRETAPNIFDDFDPEVVWGSVVEREMPVDQWYEDKRRNYSMMQYQMLHDVDWKWNNMGAEYFNMGMIVVNTDKLRPWLRGQTPKEFLTRYEFKQFVDGMGNWKWSTDQTLLNWWLKKYKIPVQHMHWKWNGLFTANNKLRECEFVHFFLKDKLPHRGEDVASLMTVVTDGQVAIV